jgi:hypothetical protein
MLQISWLFVGLVASGATLLTLTTSDDQTAILTGLIGTISWALFAYSSLHVVTHSGGSEFVSAYPSLAAFGVMMAVPNLFVALTGPLRAADPRELAEEVR